MSPRSGLNQDIIINKALEIADQAGMEAVTMATLARALTIKPPSLYNHFSGLAEVKQAMAVKALTLLSRSLTEATINKQSALSMVQAIGTDYIAFATHHPGIYEASLSAPNSSAENVQLAGEPIVLLTKEALSSYGLSKEEMIHAVRGLRSLLHGLVDLKRRGGFNLHIDLEKSQEMMIETFLKGLS